jgi:hypothetical protein
VIASSSTVLANLAYLIGAVVVAVIGGLAVWLRHRQPKSVDANMASFRRGLSALAPDQPSAQTSRPTRPAVPAPALTHVRVEPRRAEAGEDDVPSSLAAGETGSPTPGGQPG